MKKLLSVSIAVFLLAIVLGTFGLTASAAETEGFYRYVISNGEAVITGVDKSISGDAVIPDTLGGYPVTAISSSAFFNCTSLEGVTIPEGVTSIGGSAFSGCSSLEYITLPEGVASIGNYAFKGCSSLASITIPEGVTSIGKWAFFDCACLTDITIPESVTSIGAYAFDLCKSLESITLPKGITSIENCVFSGCESLKSANIPESVTNIGDYVFYGCRSLESITLPESVMNIGIYAFEGCESLKSITIPKNVIGIGNSAFAYCISLESINIPEGVKSIGDYVFEGCTALERVFVYSKDCEFSSDCGLNYNNTIFGFTGSTAEAFANQIGAEFIDINKKSAKITTEPQTQYVQLGEKAKFTVKAEGEGLTYQWYYKDADGTKYKKCSGAKSTYSIEMTEARKDRKFYCIIKDKYGNEVKSKTVYMRMAASIKTEPKTQYVQLGDKAKFTVKAVGDDLKYQWYYKSAGSSKYKKASCTKSSYTITMTEDRKDRKFYCIVTDKKGNEVKSKTVTMKLAASIKTEPKSVKTSIGKKATFTVKAVGDGLKYQWYYKDTDSSKYKKASCTKATYSIELTKARNGRKFYCVVTDKYGNTVKSKTVSMKKK